MVKYPDDFIPTFSEQIRELIPHDFIAKKQSEYLKMCKEHLELGEYVVVSDFSENYTFVIQVQKLPIKKSDCRRPPVLIFIFESRMKFNQNTGLAISAQSIHLQSTTVIRMV